MPRHYLQLVTGQVKSPPTNIEAGAEADSNGGLTQAVAAATAGGVDGVQLRAKELPARDLLARAVVLSQMCRALGAHFVVNDRLDVALLVGAHGVHLGERALPPGEARRLLPPPGLIGASVHSLAGAQTAAAAGADYVTFGNVFPTATHPGRRGAGVDALAAVVRAVNIPVLAIGGINTENAAQVLATGCAGIAVISSILGQPDPQAAAQALRHILDQQTLPPRRALTRPRPTRQPSKGGAP